MEDSLRSGGGAEGVDGVFEAAAKSEEQTAVFFPVEFLDSPPGWLLGWRVHRRPAAAAGRASSIVCGARLAAVSVSLARRFVHDLNERLLKKELHSPPATQPEDASAGERNSTTCGLHWQVLPQEVELVGWWCGSARESRCPYTADLNASDEGLWMELRLRDGLPERVEGAATASAARSPSFVFLFQLPASASLSVIAAAPFDVAQAAAASPFTLRGGAVLTLIRSAASLEEERQPLSPEQKAEAAEDPPTCFEAAVHLLNFTACLAQSAEAQASLWRERRQRQLRAAAGDSGGTEAFASSCSFQRQTDAAQASRSLRALSCGSVQTAPRRVLLRVLSFVGAAFFPLLNFLLVASALAARTFLRLFRGSALDRASASSPRLFWSVFSEQLDARLRVLAAGDGAVRRVRALREAGRLVESREAEEAARQTTRREKARDLQEIPAHSPFLSEAEGGGSCGRPCGFLSFKPRPGRRAPSRFFLPAILTYGALAALLFDIGLGLFLPQLVGAFVSAVLPDPVCGSRGAASPSSSFSSEWKHSSSAHSSPPSQSLHVGGAAAALADASAAVELLVLPQKNPSSPGKDQEHSLARSALADAALAPDNAFTTARWDLIDAQLFEIKRSWNARQQGHRQHPTEKQAATAEREEEARRTQISEMAKGASRAAPFVSRVFLLAEQRPSPTRILAELFSRSYCVLHAQLLSSHVRWLMANPAGVKLNPNISRLLGSVILTVMQVANGLAVYLESALLLAEKPLLGERSFLEGLRDARRAADSLWKRGFLLSAQSGEAGARSASFADGGEDEAAGVAEFGLALKSAVGRALAVVPVAWRFPSAAVFFAAAADLLRVSTFHIFYIYVLCARLLHFNLRSLHSLFLLFRGKKFNVLRQRVDSVSLQVDQLLLGCLLFTVAVCIFPTVLIFYVSYLLIWLFIFTVHAALRLAVLLVCRWPFYLLLCRIRQPELFSTAVRLRRVKATWQSDPTDSLYFFVDPIAVPLADVLRPAADLAVAATLSPLRPSALLSKAARGEVIAVS